MEELTDSKSNHSDNNIRKTDKPADGTGKNGHDRDLLTGQEKPPRKKFLRRLFSILFNLLLVIILIPPLLAFLFRSPEIQTLSGRLVTSLMSDYLKIDAKVDAIKIDFRTGITLKGLTLNDQRGNPIIAVKELKAKPVYLDFGIFGLVFSKLELDGAVFRYARYKGDKEYNLKMLINRFSPPDSIRSGGQFKLNARKLILKNSRFWFYDEQRHFADTSGMNYTNILFDSINLTATRFHIVNDSLNFYIDSLSTVERSGIRISKLSTAFSISSSGLHAKGLLLNFDNSHFDLDLDFNYHTWLAYASFIDSVEMVADIRPSEVMISDLSYFNKIMAEMPNKVGITGKVRGPVSNMKGQGIRIHYGKKTRLALDGRIKGLPDFFSAYITADIREMTTTPCELKSFSLPVKEKFIDVSPYLDCHDFIKGSLKFEGYYNKFSADLALQDHAGDVEANVQFLHVINDTVHFTVALQGDYQQLGRLLKQANLLGNAKFDIRLKGNGHTFNDLYLESAGTLYSFDLAGYRYSRIRYFGEYENDSAWGGVVVGDKNLMLKASAHARLGNRPLIKLNADLRRANLDDLNLGIIRDFALSSIINLEIKGIDPDTMTGRLNMYNTVLTFGKDYYKTDTITVLKSIDPNGIHQLQLKSAFADLSLKGKYYISTFPERVVSLLDHYFNAIPMDTAAVYPPGEYAVLNATLKRDDLIAEQFVPGLTITDAQPFQLHFNFDQNNMATMLGIGKITYKGIDFRNNRFKISTNNGRLGIDYQNDYTIMRDSTAENKQVFGLDNLSFRLEAGDDSLNYGLFWRNRDTLLTNTGDIAGTFVSRDGCSVFRIGKMDVVINDTLWTINRGNRIVDDSTGVSFEKWNLFGGTSKMGLSGNYPQHNGDTLKVEFNHWNLSNFDMLTALWNFDVDGTLNGDMEFSKIKNNTAFISNIKIDSLFLNKVYLGDVSMLNTWNNDLNGIKLYSSIVRKGTSGGAKVVSIDGNYFPFRTENVFDLSLSFNRFKIKAVENFFSYLVSDVEGVASGELELKGSPDKPVLTGYVDTHRTAMRINYLNTKYSFSNVINFEPDGINFDKLVIYDTLGNSAKVNGSLKYEYFKNARFDVNISTDRLLFFNTTRKMNDLYYGTAITSGNIHLSGSPSKLHLDMNVKTQQGTNVNLPMDYSVEISDKDYIVFVQHQDTLAAKPKGIEKNVEKKEGKQEYDIRLGMQITPEAKVSIFLPSDVGKIESQGHGDLVLKANSNGDFSLVGDYIVSEGMFNFSLGNLISKRFELVRGGRISWTGNPYEGIVDIKGLYKVKTSLKSLGIVIDSSANFRNKVTVNCYVILKNRLMNPDIRFEILMPELDPDLKRLVYAQLDTTNQAMMNEQMISLLVLGTFSYSNAANISLSSSYYAVLSNQLSSILSKISKDVDIGVNYKPGDAVSQEEFEVALSTQFLNDRLTIEGHFGMTYDRSNQNASNIVGDVDLSYALTEDGRWLLKAYNHSNVNSWYNYSSYEKVSPYTQGVGIAYRKDFTNIAEFFRRSRPKKQKKKKKENKD